ncbi:MAG: phosphate ABC transporter permease subunit PstC [Thermoanaerobacterales bacterium]|nr:phosphate ABC transporter permease subunit PstC [Thermoanaerobacterales bacterium]
MSDVPGRVNGLEQESPAAPDSPGLRRRRLRARLGFAATAACAALVIVLTAAIALFIGSKGLATFFVHGADPLQFFFSTQWWPDRPLEDGGPLIGALSFIVGSVIISVLAVLVSAPLGVTCAVFMTEISAKWGLRLLQPTVELLAGIPSVVYGYIGLSLLVPFIRGNLGGTGFSVLAGFLVLSVMILPTITSVATDVLRGLPREYKEAALALGSTRWQAIRLVLLPAGLSGIMTGVVLGLARAFGEALAVQMVIGNKRELPHSILDPLITLTSGITMDMGNTVQGSLWNSALWSMAMVLLAMSFAFILLIRFFTRREALR